MKGPCKGLPQPSSSSCLDGASSASSVASLYRHDDCVFLDTLVSGVQVLTHTLTLERHELPGPQVWGIMYDDEGFAALQADDDAEGDRIIIVEEFLRFQVYKAGEAEFYIMTADETCGNQQVNLSDMRLKFTDNELQFHSVGPRKVSTTFELAVMKWPRMYARVFFSSRSVYQQLGFTMFSGEPWRWAAGSVKRWMAALALLGLVDHILPSCNVLSKTNQTSL